jgi:hypothetical protein
LRDVMRNDVAEVMVRTGLSCGITRHRVESCGPRGGERT